MPWAAAAVVLLAALGTIVYFGGRSLGWFDGKAYVHPRDVSGMQYQKAESVLAKEGLKSKVVSFEVGSAASFHLVLHQNPQPNNLVVKDTVVYLTVSSGPKQAFLPYVIGQSYANALNDITSRGFKVRKVTTTTVDQAQIGTVANESPPYGSYYAQGTFITLTVYKGLAVAEVPTKGTSDVSEQTARDALTLAGFTPVLGRQAYSQSVPVNWVITTYPAARSLTRRKARRSSS